MLRYIFFICFILSFASVVSAGVSSTPTYHRVTNIENVYEISYVREYIPSSVIECSGSDGRLGEVIGGVTGAIIGNRVGRGRGRFFTTIIGAGSGAYLGHEIAGNHNRECYRVPVERYIEKEYKTLVGHMITLDNGEVFQTKETYRIGEVVRVKTTYE